MLLETGGRSSFRSMVARMLEIGLFHCNTGEWFYIEFRGMIFQEQTFNVMDGCRVNDNPGQFLRNNIGRTPANRHNGGKKSMTDNQKSMVRYGIVVVMLGFALLWGTRHGCSQRRAQSPIEAQTQSAMASHPYADGGIAGPGLPFSSSAAHPLTIAANHIPQTSSPSGGPVASSPSAPMASLPHSTDPLSSVSAPANPVRGALEYPLKLKGIVSYSRLEKFAFPVKGRINYVIQPGTLVEGCVFSEKGEVEQKGTLLASLNPSLLRHNIEAQKKALSEVQALSKYAKAALERNKTLVQQGAVSLDSYERLLADYTISTEKIRKNQEALAAMEEELLFYQIYAPFNGIVLEVFTSTQNAGIENTVLTLAAFTPMSITVPIPPELATSLDKTVELRVYPPNGDAPLPGNFTQYGIFPDHIVGYVDNPVRCNAIFSEEEKPLPKVTSTTTLVKPSDFPADLLWVEPQAIQKDGEDDYLIRFRFSSNSKRKRTGTLERIPVKTKNQFRAYGGIWLWGVTAKTPMNSGDILVISMRGISLERLSEAPAKAVYAPIRPLFLNGQTVDVELRKR